MPHPQTARTQKQAGPGNVNARIGLSCYCCCVQRNADVVAHQTTWTHLRYALVHTDWPTRCDCGAEMHTPSGQLHCSVLACFVARKCPCRPSTWLCKKKISISGLTTSTHTAMEAAAMHAPCIFTRIKFLVRCLTAQVHRHGVQGSLKRSKDSILESVQARITKNIYRGRGNFTVCRQGEQEIPRTCQHPPFGAGGKDT